MPTKEMIKLTSSVNIAKDLDESKLTEIANKVSRAFNIDSASLDLWMIRAKEITALAEMEECGSKEPGKSAFQSPLIARACIVFASNIIPEFVIDDKLAKAKVYGKDPNDEKLTRARNVASCINYQLMNPKRTWTDNFGKSLSQLACVGTVFRKIVWDDTINAPVVYNLNYDEVYLHIDNKSLEEARTITHKYTLHYNDLISKHRKGVFLEPPVSENDQDIDSDRDQIHTILEQHRWLDLDDDGYEEPYIVYLHQATNKVLRIVARYTIDDVRYGGKDNKEVVEIVPEEYFTMMSCLYSFKGKLFGLGYGHILYGIQHTFDTAANQIIDAATLSNKTTLIMDKSANYKKETMELKTGQINLFDFGGGRAEDFISKIQFNEPSPTLYNFLGFLDTFAKEISTTTDAMMGSDFAHNMKTGATNSILERGMKVYNAIKKRVMGTLCNELEKIYKLNQKHLSQEFYSLLLDDDQASVKRDFMTGDLDILPIADPNLSSENRRASGAELLLQLKDDPVIPPPNKMEILREVARLVGIENPDRFLPDMIQAQKDPAVVEMEQKLKQQEAALQQAQQQLQQQQQEFQLKVMKEERDTYEKMAKLETQEREDVRKHLREILKLQQQKKIEEDKIDAAERQSIREERMAKSQNNSKSKD